jgi:hypothetical protein
LLREPMSNPSMTVQILTLLLLPLACVRAPELIVSLPKAPDRTVLGPGPLSPVASAWPALSESVMPVEPVVAPSVACEFEALGSVELWLPGASESYALVRDFDTPVSVRYTIGIGEGSAVFATATTQELVLRGGAEVDLHFAKPTLTHGFLIPTGPVKRVKGEAGALTVEPVFDKLLVTPKVRNVAVLASCAKFTVTPSGVELNSITGTSLYQAVLEKGDHSLRASPGGTALATLHVPEDVHAGVDVYAEASANLKVGFDVGDSYVLGWVKRSEVGMGGFASSTSRCWAGLPRGNDVTTEIRKCAADLPLLIAHEGKRYAVGHLVAGAPVRFFEHGGELEAYPVNRLANLRSPYTFLVSPAAARDANCVPK